MSMTRYRPRCRLIACSGGGPGSLKKVTAEQVHLTPAVLERRGETNAIYRCWYCGFVWFQKSSDRVGLDPVPAGHYDNPAFAPNRFEPVPLEFPIRRDTRPTIGRRSEARVDRLRPVSGLNSVLREIDREFHTPSPPW